MHIYIKPEDENKSITYKELNGERQFLYINDNEGFIFKSLKDHDKEIKKNLCDEIRNKVEQAKIIYEWQGTEITIEEILRQIKEKINEDKM